MTSPPLHHVSLSSTRRPSTLQSIMHRFEDHVGDVDYSHSIPGLIAPRFDVNETEFGYVLEGEIAGVSHLTDIKIEWVKPHVLLIWGVVAPQEAPKEDEDGSELTHAPKHLKPEYDISGKPVVEKKKPASPTGFPRQILHERQLGEFQRSFTFPAEIEQDNLKAHLEAGLLRVEVPKSNAGLPIGFGRISTA